MTIRPFVIYVPKNLEACDVAVIDMPAKYTDLNIIGTVRGYIERRSTAPGDNLILYKVDN